MRSRIKISAVFADDRSIMPVSEKEVTSVAESVCSGEGLEEGAIDFIFVGDKKIRELNREFLGHDYSTDVIAFSLADEGEPLEGEIYISSDTAERQAEEFNVTFENEMLRLVIHGTLHLCGYDDGTKGEKRKMLDKGENYLKQFYNSRQEI